MSILKTSKEAREIMRDLHKKTGLRSNLWARTALCLSLYIENEPEPFDYDSDGTEFQESTLFGKDKQIIYALIRQKLKRDYNESEIVKIVKPYIEKGIRIINREYLRLNKRGDELLIWLIEKYKNNYDIFLDQTGKKWDGIVDINDLLLSISLGNRVNSDDEVIHKVNAPGQAPHIAIMGRNGTGKTRTALSILMNIKKKTHYNIPMMIFDYAKGDIANNKQFIDYTNSIVFRLPGDQIPLSPLSITIDDEYSIPLSARRFRDTIKSVVRLGTIQSGRCLDIITELYNLNHNPEPTLEDLLDFTREYYSINNQDEDTLFACIKNLGSFPLFSVENNNPNEYLFGNSSVIDIHKLPEELRKLTTFLILDKLYSEFMALPDSPLDENGNRQIRMIILIDEAHHFLPCRQETLQNLVREARSKGVLIMLLSQSPDDFDQPKYNFTREMGLSIIFSCYLERPKMLEALLGGKIDPIRISKLDPGVALCRTSEYKNPIEIQAWKPLSGLPRN